ncbi:MAG: nitrogenase component 1 [Spirochaetales bacterium]|nr:nitrogenase component 1 [Spirochaetales bacterium]
MSEKSYAHASNPCRQCTPLGASWAFKGIENCMSVLHGSQGCATYIRRYMISHFREPIDIASSSFDETTVIFGGEQNLEKAILNVAQQYNPSVIGIGTTCLSETIGDDVDRIIITLKKKYPDLCPLIPVSTPSYQGTQEEGFLRTVSAAVQALAGKYEFLGDKEADKSAEGAINLFTPMISPADMRWIKNVMEDLDMNYTLLPDYSETLDGGMWSDYHAMPPGGTPMERIISMDQGEASLELGSAYPDEWRPGYYLQKRFGVPNSRCGLPVGIDETDRFLTILSEISGKEIPRAYGKARSRLIDAYSDAHKYLYGKKVVIFGDTSTVEALYRLVSEIGMDPVLCFTGSPTGILPKTIERIPQPEASTEPPLIKENFDFGDAESLIEELQPDLMIGNSKGYKISRKTGIPLLRMGFPVHDRFGAARLRMLGYEGSAQLLDRIVNVVMEEKQSKSKVGYTYI